MTAITQQGGTADFAFQGFHVDFSGLPIFKNPMEILEFY